MGFIGWIIVGIVAGWLAGVITKTDRSIWGDLVLGLIGAFVAGLITDGLIGGDSGLIVSILVAAVAAAVLVLIKNAVMSRSRSA
ncbi:MAG: GlsB/YeaQ/YmgE family stress response membrane protein [Chloroflexota bacterium]|nr:GlsB/YeaQ/YmgE family stress response membrane protein [Chloroflexota bacterium]